MRKIILKKLSMKNLASFLFCVLIAVRLRLNYILLTIGI